MTEITMYDYILEEKDVLLNILQKRKTITRPFCTLLQEKNVDELVLCGSGTSYHAALAPGELWKICFKSEFALNCLLYSQPNRKSIQKIR